METEASQLSQMEYTLTCKYSGVYIGRLSYSVVAGYAPYLSHWDNMVAMHPIFSMPRSRLLAFARAEWKRLAKASDDGEASGTENTLLQICFLAVFHSLDSVIQQEPSLPSLRVVHDNMSRLFALAYWKHFLDSKRFHFPEFKINSFNTNNRFENIHHYLDACFAAKNSYENSVQEAIEQEKISSAERAMNALRSQWIAPASNKMLWRWVRAHIPAQWEADAQGWMSTLFLGTKAVVLEFDEDEVDLLQFVIESECAPGTAIMHAVRERISWIRTVMHDTREAFTVNFESDLTDDARAVVAQQAQNLEQELPIVLPPQPDKKQFTSLVAFIKANATWSLTCRAIEEQKAAKLKALSPLGAAPPSSPEQLLVQAIARQQQKDQLF